jgi:hypothetical protein
LSIYRARGQLSRSNHITNVILFQWAVFYQSVITTGYGNKRILGANDFQGLEEFGTAKRDPPPLAS